MGLKCSLKIGSDVSLHLIDLPLSLEGYHHFIGIWLILDQLHNQTVLVDVGPASSVPTLLYELENLGVNQVDLILLTHVHLDHSGGLAEVLEQFPSARVVVHPKGKPHLINPIKLWESSIKVLNNVALVYGEPNPVEENTFVSDLTHLKDIICIDTPGHARHHISFFYRIGGDSILFAGEAASNFYRRGLAYPGENDGTFILRPATPKPFFLNDALSSMEKLKKLKTTIMCYSHFGYTCDSREFLGLAQKQLLLWQDIIQEYSLHENDQSIDMNSIIQHLIEKDPWLGDLSSAPEDIRTREEGFMRSSVLGFIDGMLREK